MTTLARAAALGLVAASFVAVPRPALAQTPAPQTIVVEDQNADRTREALEEVLKRYPPSLAYVLKLDPSLLSKPDYLAPYPVLQQFLAKHPEVVRSPKYYFDEYTVRDNNSNYYNPTPEQSAINMWRSNIEGFTFLLGFLSVLGAVTWVIKSIVDHRRWGRQAKVQAEVHNKVIDRLASNEEMLAYVQSPAGAGFLKSGPAMSLNGGNMKITNAPYNRILWSAQAGVVFLALGLGFRWVNVTAPGEVLEMLHFFGLIGQSLGIGFIASAALAYGLSWKMGLLDTATPPERTPPSHS
ncbi:MAG: hypothetical protein EPO35_03780 [Acidobacteria bacterium]|nr:MAG: hypothetical protein EPO35_03780 [Acidobacteriota bacterium]